MKKLTILALVLFSTTAYSQIWERKLFERKDTISILVVEEENTIEFVYPGKDYQIPKFILDSKHAQFDVYRGGSNDNLVLVIYRKEGRISMMHRTSEDGSIKRITYKLIK